MYISPNHPDPPRRPEPPPDDGRRLGAVSRGDGRDELRVTLKTFAGRPFVSLRVWSRDDDGAWWPVKGKGVSVRLGEVSGVIEALRRAAAVAGPQQGGQGDTGPRGGPRTAGAGGGSRGGAPSGPGEGDHDAGKPPPDRPGRGRGGVRRIRDRGRSLMTGRTGHPPAWATFT